MFLMADGIPQENSNIPSILGSIGMAVLTAMVSFAIAIFTNKKYGIGDDDKKDYKILDNDVLLEHVIRPRKALVYLFLTYAPVLLWALFSFSSWWTQILSLLSWVVGVCGTAYTLAGPYRWMRGDRDKYRRDYLKTLDTPNKLKGSPKLWRSVWEVEGRQDHQEKEFFIIFSSAIDKLLKSNADGVKVASELIKDFNALINKRPMIFLVVLDEVFPKILEWHFLVWKKTQEGSYSDDISVFYEGIEQRLSYILEQVQKRTLKKAENFSLFNKLKLHVEKHAEDSSEKEHDETYIESVMSGFFDRFLENAKENRNVWIGFPSKWTITDENMKKEPSNQVVLVLFKKLKPWAENRILNLEAGGCDTVLDNCIENLFPESDPILWRRILAFSAQPFMDEQQMRLLIERPINFSGIKGVTSSVGERTPEEKKKQIEKDKEIEKAKKKETIYLALRIEMLTEEFLNGHIAKFEEMKRFYSVDILKTERIQEYINFFKEINKQRKEFEKGGSQ